MCSGGDGRAATAGYARRRSTPPTRAVRSMKRAARSAIGCAMQSVSLAGARTASVCAPGSR
ncbi:hypothetical protein DN546_22215 [Burkholderia multivorans]|nr:hypothetical protein DN515_17365 [Burkholderia multivorans]RAB91503.1 hypothetical protein DN556_00555 [Burkholderia multivorans]RAC37165.1 hypothetical protein DN561_23095 [Burkholderia multivorans]RAD44396.1 hypothetical protein DN535_13415 [Burkholderia multivorans]RAD54298.1 hypothetical protein DN572_21125 [Burkholderia multivorans]